jgi:signal transduction histidine kinase
MTIAESGLAAAPACLPQSRGTAIRVLLLEDNAADRILVEELLRGCTEIRFELACFSRLAPALHCLKTRRFDAAVIDMVLPDAAGMEIYGQIRAVAPELPVVVLTSSSDTGRFDVLLKAGAQDCLVKLHPLGQVLPRAIRYAIERHRISEELARRVKELARSEDRLHSLIDANSDAMLIVGGGGAVRFANRSAARMFGFSTPQLLGRNLGLPLADDRQPVEIDIVRGDGKSGRAELRSMPMMWDGENVRLATLRDITALREAEARQAEIAEQLRHAQKIDALGTLAGGIAHDLNNILVPIRTLTPVLKRSPGRSEQELHCLDLIMAAAARASRLVRQILAFSRKQAVERQPMRLDALVEDCLTMLRAGNAPYVRIDTAIAAAPEILGNQGQIYQVLLNLVLNAAQAIGERPGTIAIAVAPDEKGVRLSVSDSGGGMDEETQRRIFEPFFTTRAASEGTGLGLSVVKGIVTEHGGTIAVASSPESGTRFDVVFPRLSREAA